VNGKLFTFFGRGVEFLKKELYKKNCEKRIGFMSDYAKNNCLDLPCTIVAAPR